MSEDARAETAVERVRALMGKTSHLRNLVRDAIHDRYCGIDRECARECEAGGSGDADERIVAVAAIQSAVLSALDGTEAGDRA